MSTDQQPDRIRQRSADDNAHHQPKTPSTGAVASTITLKSHFPDLIHRWCFKTPLLVDDAVNVNLINRLRSQPRKDSDKIDKALNLLYPTSAAEESIWPEKHKKTEEQFATSAAKWFSDPKNLEGPSTNFHKVFMYTMAIPSAHEKSLLPLFESLFDLFSAFKEEIHHQQQNSPSPASSFRFAFSQRLKNQQEDNLMGVFQRVVVDTEKRKTLNARHEDASVGQPSSSAREKLSNFWKYTFRQQQYDTIKADDFAGVPKLWEQGSSEVLTISGPSGSGKTMLALEVATQSFLKNASAFYLEPPETEKWIVVHSRRKVYDNDKDRRDDAVEQYIKRQIEELLDVKTLEKFVHDPAANKHHVVIIIDEIGSRLEFLRGLANVSDKLANSLHAVIFPQQHHQQAEDDANKKRAAEESRVHFIAAGTGQHMGKSGLASDGTRLARIYLKPESEIFKSLFDSTLKAMSIDLALKRKLEALSTSVAPVPAPAPLANSATTATASLPTISPSFSSTEAIISNLVTNLRCGVLFIKELVSILSELKDFMASSAPDMHQALLLRAATQTITSFVKLNGLGKLPQDTTPTDVIGISIVITALRFPVLPANPSASELYFSDPDLSLSKLLCTIGGVLVDCGRNSGGQSPEAGKGEVTFETFKENDTEKEQYIVGDNKYESRFDCTHAFAAVYLLELGVMNRSNDWRSFELRFADLSLIISSKSSLINDMFYQSNDNENNALISAEILHEAENVDPLITLKRDWLVFGAENTGQYQKQCCKEKNENNNVVKYPKVVASEFIQLQKGRTDLETFDEERLNPNSKWCQHNIEHYRNRIFSSLERVETNSAEPTVGLAPSDSVASVLVLATVDKESFADIIVLGPYKVVLIQCKQDTKNATDRNTADADCFDEDFEKMGMDKKVSGRARQKAFVDHLKKMCVRSDDENSEFVQVCSCVVVEGKSDQWLAARYKYMDLTEYSKKHPKKSQGNISVSEPKLAETKYKMLPSQAYHKNHSIAVFGFSPASARPRASALYPLPIPTGVTAEHSESATLATVLPGWKYKSGEAGFLFSNKK